MSETTKPIEFEVNFVDYADGKVLVSGRNYEQNISVGEVFLWAYRVTVKEVEPYDFTYHYSNKRSISLCVEAIEAYRRSVEILGHGGTGRLTLAGEGFECLTPYNSVKPHSYDLLRVNQYELARRPVGLAEGDFVVPDDFDDPLPPELQRYFEGYEDPMR